MGGGESTRNKNGKVGKIKGRRKDLSSGGHDPKKK